MTNHMILKSRYDYLAKQLSTQAKKRRLAREAGKEWKLGSADEIKYWSLKSKLELVAKKLEA